MRPPLQEYAARKSDRAATAAARERVHVHLGNAKVAVFIVTLIYSAATIDHLSSMVFGAAAGAVIGAITGGKKGAAIGSAVGAGAGTGVVLATDGKEIRLAEGRKLKVSLTNPLTIRTK